MSQPLTLKSLFMETTICLCEQASCDCLRVQVLRSAALACELKLPASILKQMLRIPIHCVIHYHVLYVLAGIRHPTSLGGYRTHSSERKHTFSVESGFNTGATAIPETYQSGLCLATGLLMQLGLYALPIVIHHASLQRRKARVNSAHDTQSTRVALQRLLPTLVQPTTLVQRKDMIASKDRQRSYDDITIIIRLFRLNK